MCLHPGEAPATGWRVETLSDVLQRLRKAAPDVAGRPRLVAIDGRGGAGKSTLVERLRGIVPASGVVHTDDVAWNHAYFDWGDLMVENILRPLHRGEGVEFRPQAWIEHDRPGAIRVPAGADVVWVEGTGIIREEFAPWIDASIWVQGDLDEQERRLVARNCLSRGRASGRRRPAEPGPGGGNERLHADPDRRVDDRGVVRGVVRGQRGDQVAHLLNVSCMGEQRGVDTAEQPEHAGCPGCGREHADVLAPRHRSGVDQPTGSDHCFQRGAGAHGAFDVVDHRRSGLDGLDVGQPGGAGHLSSALDYRGDRRRDRRRTSGS